MQTFCENYLPEIETKRTKWNEARVIPGLSAVGADFGTSSKHWEKTDRDQSSGRSAFYTHPVVGGFWWVRREIFLVKYAVYL